MKNNPALVFISEPQLFTCDSLIVLGSIKSSYKFHLNSEDNYDQDLPLSKMKAWGGTLALWHSEIGPFVTIIPSTSSSILALVLDIPGLSPSIHFGIYLPTAGKDSEFFSSLADLESMLLEIEESYPGAPL